MSKTDKKKALADSLFNNMTGLSNEMEIKDLSPGAIDESTGKAITYVDVDSLEEAPKEWDQFPDHTKEEYLRLKFSIMNTGLIQPISVWDRGREGKVILAGKNRTRIYKEIRDSKEGNPDVDYSKIPAIIYGRREIDEEKARDIIVDSNTQQRKDNTKDLPFVVQHRVSRINKNKDKKGDTMDQVAKEMNLSRTKIYEERIFANEIDENITALFFNGILNRKTALRFKKIDKSAQSKVYEKFLKGITREQVKERNLDDRTKKLKKGMSFEEIKEVLTHDPDDLKTTITLRIPQSLENRFMKMAEKWIEENSN